MLSSTPPHPWLLQRVLSGCATDEGDSTIDMLTDNVLLEIFYFYQDLYRIDPDGSHPSYRGPAMPLGDWRRLIHVCRRWRQIILESPRRLNLQILCTHENRFKKSLSIWPDFPIAIKYRSPFGLTSPIDQDDVIAALEHPNRVIRIEIISSQLGKLGTVLSHLHKPFPALTRLDLCSKDGIHDLPDEFLGGSAPCLEEITLSNISFPALPTLLLSAKDLVKLNLYGVPPTGHISPAALVACLAELPRLDTLRFEYMWATVRVGQIHPLPITRVILPALTRFQFIGISEYLEDLVAQIDCPELEYIAVFYTNPVVDFQVAPLAKFLDRSVGPEMSPRRPTEVRLDNGSVAIKMYRDPNHPNEDLKPTTITIFYCWTDRQSSHIARVLDRFSAILSTVAHLSLVSTDLPLGGADDVDCLHLLLPFSATRTLHVSSELARHVAPALEDIPAERITKVLPSLCLTYFEGPKSSLEKFVAARGLSDRPVLVAGGKLEYDEILEYFVTEPEGVTKLE